MMTKVKTRKGKDLLLFICTLFAFILILLFPKTTSDAARAGLSLSYAAVIPSVFPSLVLTEILFSRPTNWIEGTVGRLFSRLFLVSPRGSVAWVAGLLSGFPVGAQTVASDVKRGLLSKEEGEYLLSFVNNTGPAFLIGGIGLGLFRSVSVGLTLYLLQIPVSLLVGFLLRPAKRLRSVITTSPDPLCTDPVSAVVKAGETSVRIAGFICFFSVLSSLFSLFLPKGLPRAVVSSFLEVGSGSLTASRLPFPIPALPLVAFSIFFSGLSVHGQTLSLLNDAGLSSGRYWTGKTLSGVFGFSLCLLFYLTK